MTKPDDLQKGQYVVIAECTDWAAYCRFDYYRDEYVPPAHDGRPLEILEVSLPFVCVTNGQIRFAIDTRAWELQRVTKEYAAAMAQAQPGVAPAGKRKRNRGSVFEPRPVRIERDPRDCPRCGDRMAEVRGERSTTWTLVCRRCGHSGGPVIVQ